MIGIRGKMLHFISMLQGEKYFITILSYLDFRPYNCLFSHLRGKGEDLVVLIHTSTQFFLRDFSAANMVGAKGLLGRSWPDLDMLPLGLLTDPGEDSACLFPYIS